MWHKQLTTEIIAPQNHEFWENLWRTPEMKKIMLEDPEYSKILERAKELVWWWVEPTQEYERFHFSAWFGNTILKRDYESPLHQDLFHLHDILHAITFENKPLGTEENWRNRMRANEIAVSLETEVLFYFRFPHLREQSFDFKIWHDEIKEGISELQFTKIKNFEEGLQLEFLDGWQKEKNLRNGHPENWFLEFPKASGIELSYEQLWNLRRIISRTPNINSKVEMMLASYEGSSNAWENAWQTTWQDVELERQIFQDFCAHGKYKSAIERRHKIWEIMANSDGIPYGNIAKSFHQAKQNQQV